MAMKPLFGKYDRVHLVGIGGIGMEGLARILKGLGCQVSGSDRVCSASLESLRQDGFEVHVGHRSQQLGAAELLVFSTAVPLDNEELSAARCRGIAVVSRAELLGELTRRYLSVGIAGSHGKTTTATMLADILRCAGRQPSVLIGGRRHGRIQAELGAGELFVVEADEFERGFLHFYPSWTLVTNVDAEHLDCYTDLGAVEQAFSQYLSRLPFYGHCLLAGDGRVGAAVLNGLRRPGFTFGMGEGNDFRACRIESAAWGSRCHVLYGDLELGELEVPVPGEHNLRNALGAAALAHTLGIAFADIAAGVKGFIPVARRFESLGEVNGVLVIDDYAHHPAEVAAALAAARQNGRRVVAAFQPHLYSRTRALGAAFAQVLCAADRVFLTGIYAAREEPLPGVDAGTIVRAMQDQGFSQVELVADKDELAGRLLAECRSGDLVITLGAGDIETVGPTLLNQLRSLAG